MKTIEITNSEYIALINLEDRIRHNVNVKPYSSLDTMLFRLKDISKKYENAKYN